MSKSELLEKLAQLRLELNRERGTIASGTKVESPGRVKELRRTIARILTVLKEKG